MNLKELSSPIRLYWDLGPAEGRNFPDRAGIATQIVAAKILSLQITEPGRSLSRACLAILDALKDKTIAISLVAPLPALDSPALKIIDRYPVRMLLVAIESPADCEAISEIKKQTREKTVVGAAFSVMNTNLHQLPGIVRACVDRRIANVTLPMQRLTRNDQCFSLSRKEREKLTSQLEEIDKPAWLKVIIHDPFLWRTFFPAVEFPDGGCQAANTMLYISPEAAVYPCPSFPIPLGDLRQSSLRDVINSRRKKEVRKSILASPSECEGCEELRRCKGGCRGRAYAMKKSLNGRDPACR